MMGVWALWETAFCAVFQRLVGAVCASIGMERSCPYAAVWRSKTAGLIWLSVESRRRSLYNTSMYRSRHLRLAVVRKPAGLLFFTMAKTLSVTASW
jgi:hypothetical protein